MISNFLSPMMMFFQKKGIRNFQSSAPKWEDCILWFIFLDYFFQKKNNFPCFWKLASCV